MKTICLITSYEDKLGNASIFNLAKQFDIIDSDFQKKLKRYMPNKNFCLLKYPNEDLFGFYSHNNWENAPLLLNNHIYSILLEISQQKNIELAEMLNCNKIYLILHDKDIHYPSEHITSDSCVKALDSTEFTQYFINNNPRLADKNTDNLHVYVFKHMGSKIESYLLLNEIRESQNKIETLIEIVKNSTEKDERKAQLDVKLEFLHTCLSKTGLVDANKFIGKLDTKGLPTELLIKKYNLEFSDSDQKKLLASMLAYLQQSNFDSTSSEYIDILVEIRDYLLFEF